MWVAKIQFSSENTLVGSKLSQFDVDILGFPLSYEYAKEGINVQLAGTLIGSEKGKKDLVNSLKKEKRVKHLELNNDFLIANIIEPTYAKAFYNQTIIHVSPALVSSKGYYVIEVASYEKKSLTKIIDLVKKKYEGKLLWIKEKKITSISVTKIMPELTEKQKQALELAIKNGYYHVPRKISLQELAKKAKLSFATYQVHLRKAEQKVLPNLQA